MPESVPLPDPTLEPTSDPVTAHADALVVGLAEDRQLPPTLQRLDEAGGHSIRRWLEAGGARGKKGELCVLANPAETGPPVLLVVGIGPTEKLGRSEAFDAASAALRKLAEQPHESITLALGESFAESTHDALVAGVLFGCEGQGIYQSEPALHAPSVIRFAGVSDEALRRGHVIGRSINQTRRLVNEPAATVYPESFTERVAEYAGEVGLEVEIWDEQRLEAEGCRAILAVGAGSARPPRLMMLRHRGGGDAPPVAVVGKGVTFDSGGLSLKPSESMTDMKCDMAGAATVVGVLGAVAQLGVKKNVIGFCGLAENMISGTSYKLGDVIETRSGKTVEILNTDAEGRVVLADTLDVAAEHAPSAIVDLATLTGACMVALGMEVAGLMGNEQSLSDAVREAATAEGEPVWPLPMFELYNDKVKSKVADIKNVGEGRWGGAITAAKFLENFVGDVPWLHIDIAGPAFADSAKPHRDAGATGAMVRSLIRWIESSEGTS